MTSTTKSLEEIIKDLPLSMHSEVSDFIEFLLNKRRKKNPEKKLKQNWAGALRSCKQQYSSLELQHKIPEWRNR
jgi:hypothetical protein